MVAGEAATKGWALALGTSTGTWPVSVRNPLGFGVRRGLDGNREALSISVSGLRLAERVWRRMACIHARASASVSAAKRQLRCGVVMVRLAPERQVRVSAEMAITPLGSFPTPWWSWM
jgi:hypothetical protein